MSLESLVAQALNSVHKPVQAARDMGLFLGESRSLLGTGEARLCIPLRPPAHNFVCGRTGSGKTTLLLRIMSEYRRAGIPFFFIDFHGHATDELLDHFVEKQGIPHDIIRLDPWADRVIGLSLLDSHGEPPYNVAQEMVAILRRHLWSDSWGPRLEELLFMTLLPLACAKLTPVEATPFLSRPEFRKGVLRQVNIPEVHDFWDFRFGRLSPSQQSLVLQPVLNKVSTFCYPPLRYIIGQQNGVLDLDSALRQRQTIVAKFSAGELNGNHYLLASLLIAKFKGAVYRRPADASPYVVVLDEFQEILAW